MSYSISKELFEAVMGFGVIEFYCRKEIQYYSADKERVRCIDWIPTLSGLEYNDFFFKCKEWALKQGYILHSSIDEIGEGYLKVDHFTEELYGERVRTFKTSSEQQAVFDGCQWILDIKESELTNNEDFVTKLSGALFQIANLRIKDNEWK